MSLISKGSLQQSTSDRQPRRRSAWRMPARSSHHRVVHEFRLAGENSDAQRLGSLLDRGVAVVVDSGDAEHPTIRVLRGIPDATLMLIHGMTTTRGVDIEECAVNSQAGLMFRRGGDAIAAMTIDFTGHLISVVWIRLHPENLRRWNHV
jgi:RNA polymerase sigma-70 factor (ECF subfamily)